MDTIQKTTDTCSDETDAPPEGSVVSVCLSTLHTFTKAEQPHIHLLQGLGVLGDAHMGKTVKHRSRVAQNPNQPNLRQVHVMPIELLDELAESGFAIKPCDLGENVLTRGIDLIALPVGTRLYFGPDAVIELTGLRTPCAQIEAFQTGLLKACLDKDENGKIVRKTGVMSVVLHGGDVQTGHTVRVELPPRPHRPMEKV